MKSIEEFKAALKVQGIDYESVRRRLRDNITLAKVVRRKVTIRVSVADAEIDRFLEENREKLETQNLGADARERLRKQIREVLFRQKYEARLAAWLAEIRQRATIEVRETSEARAESVPERRPSASTRMLTSLSRSASTRMGSSRR